VKYPVCCGQKMRKLKLKSSYRCYCCGRVVDRKVDSS